jgi:hypothetical protein
VKENGSALEEKQGAEEQPCVIHIAMELHLMPTDR